jgi:hypothetical protein
LSSIGSSARGPSVSSTQLNRIGCIYEALDKESRQTVALKVEKKDKNKNILKFEYSVIKSLKGKSFTTHTL